jgi:hypothetical protein
MLSLIKRLREAAPGRSGILILGVALVVVVAAGVAT